MGAGKEKSLEQKGEKMNIKKIEEKDNHLVLLVKGTHSKFMNAIRRTVMNSVPTLAIDDISIYKNNSVLFDEYIAHRIGSLPLKADKTFKKGESIKLALQAKGPKTVLSGDIEPKNSSVEVVNKKVPLVKLKKDQEIKMEMDAVMKTGKEHVKWQPAIVSYHELPKIENQKKKIKNAKKIVEKCPKNVLEEKAGKVVLKNPYKCTLCGYCEDISKGQIKIVTSSDSFVLDIESFGQKPAKKILMEASDIIKKKAKQLPKKVSKKIK